MIELEEEYNEILQEAYKRFRKNNSGVKGQLISVTDDLDFWVFLVTKEKYDKEKDQT